MQVGHSDTLSQDGVVSVLSGEICSSLCSQGVELCSLDTSVDALDAFQRDQCCVQEVVLAGSKLAGEGEQCFRKKTGTRGNHNLGAPRGGATVGGSTRVNKLCVEPVCQIVDAQGDLVKLDVLLAPVELDDIHGNWKLLEFQIESEVLY